MISEQLEERIYQCLDGKMSEAEQKDLFQELKNHPEAMKLYCFSSALDTSLVRIARGQLSLNTSTESFADLASKAEKRRSSKIALVAAAAVIALSLIAMQWFMVKTDPPALTFEVSPGTQFTVSHSEAADEPNEMVLKEGSSLKLSQGVVELTFESGVKSIVAAPAELTLHDRGTVFLNYGRAWFYVPEQAVGFNVKTRDLDIVDLGTEFGVLCKKDDHDEIHVFKGKVQVAAQRLRKESTVLLAGEARRIDPVGRLTKIPSQAGGFLTALPKQPIYMHWSFDKVVDGGFEAQGIHTALDRGFGIPHGADARSMQVEGRFGKGIHFTGSRNEALLTKWLGVSGGHSRTVACWVRMNPSALKPGGSALVAWGLNKANSPGYHTKWKLAIDRKGRPVVVGYDGGYYAETESIADGTWHHVAAVHTTNEKTQEPVVQIYIDGMLKKLGWESPSTSEIQTPDTVIDAIDSSPVRIGHSLNLTSTLPGSVMRGQIDEVYIVEGALDAETIHRLATSNRFNR